MIGSWRHQPCSIVVSGITVDRVDVINIALLRSILDQDSGSLDPKVRKASVFSCSAPGKVSARQIGADFRHPCSSPFVIEDANPFVREVQKQCLLAVVER